MKVTDTEKNNTNLEFLGICYDFLNTRFFCPEISHVGLLIENAFVA